MILEKKEIDQLTTVNGLVKLWDWQNPFIRRSFSALKNLEHLDFVASEGIADFKELPHSLVNLKRIGFLRASIDDIMPFVRQSVAMQKIKIDNLVHKGEYTKTRVIDLLALNREREELLDASHCMSQKKFI